jgi:hypothetical protein
MIPSVLDEIITPLNTERERVRGGRKRRRGFRIMAFFFKSLVRA